MRLIALVLQRRKVPDSRAVFAANMARISIPMTPADAKAAPREFALLAQLETGPDGAVDAQVIACGCLRFEEENTCKGMRTEMVSCEEANI